MESANSSCRRKVACPLNVPGAPLSFSMCAARSSADRVLKASGFFSLKVSSAPFGSYDFGGASHFASSCLLDLQPRGAMEPARVKQAHSDANTKRSSEHGAARMGGKP